MAACSHSVDANGLATAYAYDVRGRLLSKTTGAQTTQFSYDAAGQLLSVTGAGGGVIHYEYDDAHRLISIRDSDGNRSVYTLDAAGNRTREDAFDAAGTLVQTRSQRFDAFNRLAQKLNADGQGNGYAYDGNSNLVSVTDPLGRTIRRSLDELNRVTGIVDPANGGGQGFLYDANDQLTAALDARFLKVQYAAGRLRRRHRRRHERHRARGLDAKL